MPMTRPARPVVKPGAGTSLFGRSATAKKSPAKKAARKRTAKKSAKRAAKKSAKPKSRRALKRKRDAAVEKRRQTLVTNRVDVGPEPVAVDPQDEAARAAIAKRQVRGRRNAVDRLADPPP